MEFMRCWLERLGIRDTVVGQAACSTSIASIFSGKSSGNSSAPSSSLRRPTQRSRFGLGVESLEDRTVPAAVIGTGNGLTGFYYTNQSLTGAATVTRIDPTINFNWNSQSPASSMADQNFSVRWTGVIQAPVTGTYTFSTLSDDGIRVTVNEQTIINNWTSHGPTWNNGTITLTAGQKYTIEVDYFQGSQGAVAQLWWTRPDGVHQVVPTTQLYSRDTAPPTASLNARSITVPGTAPYTFQVTYQDDVSVYGWSMHTGNVVVTGPNGYKQTATLLSVNQAGDGPTRVATYQITPPGGSWDSADSGTYTVSLQANQVRDTTGNFIAAHNLGTFSVVLAGSDWYSDHFTDPTFAGEVRSLDADHSLSRNDVITLLREVESGGVSTAEFNDLKTLVANASYLGIPDYVDNLAGKLVFGNAANATYQGKSLGNLHAGSTGTQMEELVDKWFYGSDLPAIDSGLHYQAAAGSLFGSSGPVLSNVVQGTLDDCYFLAGLGETAQHSPATIKSMFINNGDGTYTVRFYHNGTPDYVTVNLELPAASDGTFAYANAGMALNNSNNVLWVPLAEKAYAQLAQSGWSRGTTLPNAYSSINLGWEGDAVNQLTGKSESLMNIVNNTATFNAMVAAVDNGKWVGLESKATTASYIVSDHVYVLTGYNSATHMFSLYNPWGSTIQLSWGQVAGNFSAFSQNLS